MRHSTTTLLLIESLLVILVLIALGYIVIARRRLRRLSRACAAASASRHHALGNDAQSRTTDITATFDEHMALNEENNSDTRARTTNVIADCIQ